MLAKYERICISVFIILTTSIFVLIGKPTELLLFAGAINGLILPIALSIMLIAATKSRIMKGYKHPLWMQSAGWIVVLVMSWMGYVIISETLTKLM
jgi:Mn2+/Fe2+ NRAMP family transporter